ncbi:PAS domain S-box protein [Lederbergia citri]|uniref:PAS domain S-box protein n=1 Tax=Lederbergia citri TaxID=2833580 RepID=A0A942TD64_9BACI|nr:PAS domain S-box protein [Lederbergia citri]MBS4195645.1 PAS domain S-box protein [Lederbergia citri]
MKNQDKVDDKIKQDLFDAIEKLETLLEAFPDLIIFKDGRDRWINANQYAITLFGLKETDYIGKFSAELVLVKPFFNEFFLSRYEEDQRIWESRKLNRTEVSFSSQNGQYVTFDIISKPIYHQDGSRKALVIIGRDITEKKELKKTTIT